MFEINTHDTQRIQQDAVWLQARAGEYFARHSSGKGLAILFVICDRIGYNQISSVIKSFQHKGLKTFFETGNTKGIDASHAKRLEVRLDLMDIAADIEALNQPGWKLHELKGERQGTWSIHITRNYRLTFRFEDGDCHVVNYEDYH